ncbi:S41 family peptidase [Glaciecola petra]|uniref:Tricorn protease homolog n=1 Tax=Glaciecola petra TaxID=3075602 RepID=A0ABU2ZT13_9ALTE|nr:S41 family peptidase [Aestuariibacter sp. P117]MDT0595750.1 S41 family peptidase [Aestuariibacter sp. P117]
MTPSFRYLAIFLIALSQQTFASPLILQPELSPDKKMIAFSYQGDIWTVGIDGGRANRLTIHEGYERAPIWQKDSKAIAFTSDRFGNSDVFVIPVSGGMPKRLTFHSGRDLATDFTKDGKVLFSTRRTYAQVERESEIYAVSTQSGETEARFMDALGMGAVMSPDGSKIAFIRGTARVSREDYRGPANGNLWIYDLESDKYTQLTDKSGSGATDTMPKWADNKTVYFISSREGKYNVFESDLKGRISQLTKETEFGVNHFSTDKSGETIVYQAGDKVYKFDVSRKRKSAIEIDVNSDFRFDPVVNKKTTNKVEQYAVSPNGKLTAYVLRGDIYVTRNDKEDNRSVRLTQGAERDLDVTWLSNDSLLFVSDKAGQNDIYMLKSADSEQANIFKSLKHTVRAVANTQEEEHSPQVSPDGKRISYLIGRGKLLTANINENGDLSAQETLLDGWDTPEGVAWSPDSKWLAYSLADLNFNQEIYIHAADNSGKPTNVSMHPKYDISPVWSPDGSKLGFSSMRNNGDFDIWFAWLDKSEWQRSKEQWKRLDKDDTKDDKKDKKKDDKDESDEASEDDKEKEEVAEVITIDFDGIYKRLEQVTRFAGNETSLVFDEKGEHIYYATSGGGRQNHKVERNLFKIKWNGEDKKMLLKGDASPSQLLLNNKGKHVFALTSGGKITRIATKGDKSETLNVSSQMTINYAEERAQIFDDAWRALGAGFYDPNFHGQDWNALRAKYRPLALKASTKEDFQYIFNLMLGQLNASHMGLFRGENQKQTQTTNSGLLGITGVHTKSGFEVKSVLPGSPADREESKLVVGDVIMSMNQQTLKGKNLYALLNGQVDSPVLLQVKSADSADTAGNEIVIWPTASLSNANYDDWVESRRRLTDEYSKGRLGYLHIRGMNWSSFERFERELMAAGYGKEGIVIDVRYNGGGWTTDYLMAVLNVKQHAYTVPRGAAKDLEKEHSKFKDSYPFAERLPLSAWTKPSIAMSNENSYSNAEIFSHAYKALGLGKLVGRPTFGAVISTGAHRLVDGSIVRMPFRGWWVKESGDNMEFVPAVPDIEVFNPPAYKAKGIDPQLKRAVDELIKDL